MKEKDPKRFCLDIHIGTIGGSLRPSQKLKKFVQAVSEQYTPV